ncbi:uncharacterized protein LOC135939292 [Cloeon dipterum]|uniref:uncharacterized protein LOC135939292 n=1 Tax=Cloeon dipterum TaxID=197152 RepID=UPI0032206D8F
MSSIKKRKPGTARKASALQRRDSVASSRKKELNVSSLINADQIHVIQKHISSNKSVVIIPNNVSAEDQSGPSTSYAISDASMEEDTDNTLQMQSSEADDGSKSRKSKRGRPNKYIELDNGEIVKKASVVSKQPEKASKKPSSMKRLGKEVTSKDTKESVRRTSRASAGKNQKYTEFSHGDNSDSEAEQTSDCEQSLTGDTDDDVAAPVSPAPKKRKKGPARRTNKDEDYKTGENSTPRIRVKKSGLFKNDVNDQSTNKDPSLLNEITCGACNTKMTKNMYVSHRLEVHHGLTWIEGEEDPIDYYNTTILYQNKLGLLVKEAFSKFGKGTHPKKLTLPCQVCGRVIASYMGYVSHFTFCGVSDEEREKRMFQCPICKKSVTPSGRYFHESKHKENDGVGHSNSVESERAIDSTPKRAAAVKARGYLQNLEKDDGPVTTTENDGPSAEFSVIKIESRRGITWKRKSWAKDLMSLGSIKCCYIGCDHVSTDVAEYEKHVVDECPHKSTLYVCSQCNLKFQSEELVLAHYKETHKSIVEVLEEQEEDVIEETEDFEDKLTPTPNKKKARGAQESLEPVNGLSIHHGLILKCFSLQRSCRGVAPFNATVKWTMQFIKANHSTELLFPKLFDQSDFCTLKDPEEYLPLAKTSVLFSSASTMKPKVNKAFVESSEWRSLNCLSGEVENNAPVFFAGGPILSLAWCPTPQTYPESKQYLAVSCHRSMDSKLGFQEILPQNSLIQIWSLGLLKNQTETVTAPTLLMTLGHEWGAVRQLEWCPSGCWDIETNKLGLLAAACADGTVRIIPIISTIPEQPHLKAKASLTLVPHKNSERLNQCISVHWYRGKGHQVLAGGFADGLVCFWNVTSESPLLKIAGNKLLPYLNFYAHQGPVISVKIYPHTKPKFVVTAGIQDKNLLFWNLDERGENAVIQHNTKRGRFTSLDWMLCWPTPIASYEEQTFATQALTPRNFMGNTALLPQNSSGSDLTKSDWLNCVAHCTGAGEVSLFLCNQMLFGIDNVKPVKDRRAMLTRTMVTAFDLRQREGTSFTCDNPSDSFISNYEEASKRGLVFCDSLLDIDKKWPPGSEAAQLTEKMDPCCSANYPLSSISRLAWNSNISSFGWIAIGYQCGLVRLLNIKAKTTEKLLQNYHL